MSKADVVRSRPGNIIVNSDDIRYVLIDKFKLKNQWVLVVLNEQAYKATIDSSILQLLEFATMTPIYKQFKTTKEKIAI